MQFKKLKKIITIFTYITVFCLINFSKQDLPVHCLRHEIIGKWVLKVSDLYPVKSGHEMRCGHEEPSREDSSYLARSPYSFKNEYIVNLKDSDVAEINYGHPGMIGTGKWTMVYDEGFGLEFSDLSFFAFSKYDIKKNGVKIDYNSQCYSTCIGWYHNKDKTKWGCYQAFKLNENPNKITSFNSKNALNIVEPQNLGDNIINSVMNMQFKSIGDVITYPNENKISDFNFNFSQKDKEYYKKQNTKIRKNSNYYIKYLQQRTSFLAEQEKLTLRLDSTFKNHDLYVSKLHEVKKNWSAAVDPSFSKMTIKELNRFAGQKSNRQKSRQNNSKPYEDISMFPKKFDWMHLLKPSGSQGSCGSCYVYSTMRMIEARLKLNYNHDVNLSVQHALDCAIYNQGCDGGYPYLVMKYASEFELIPETCKPYTESTGKCMENTCDVRNLAYLYKGRNYHYVGGSYGKCSQKKMMEELINNGPLVVSFEPDYNFMLYKSGIYHSIDEKTWILKGIPKPEWEKVDHSVLLVGWGEDDNTLEKFWILQNTWGANWGENGFFRIRRGFDEFGIESICEAAESYIVDNLTGQELPLNKLIIKKNNQKSIEERNDYFLGHNINKQDNKNNKMRDWEASLTNDETKSIFDQFMA